MTSYRDLVVWQKAMALVSAVYKLTAAFPGSERFGLASQIQRAAVSVPSNIAEGQGRLATKEFRQFLGISRGSLKELETQLMISVDLGYASTEEIATCLDLADEIGRMLNALIKALERKSSG
ncbi:four helix bundle protein [Candidatus Bipolaricaulota bacterium]|nr:four helix bundle protein [Candidatus Bipolaricaulota bacterium]